ncbi:hypothetical protein D9619_002440 [Psilocybe cf. subviscida]|uniref:Uncharacterized protein n=1 Tax=Psilocybe cf. subviscida TaxID=2480587 RepID=A0A8H5ETT5_9AGAR|nr:hypothetical protein D9619_002440 [Psilocybe cf. subviscida]
MPYIVAPTFMSQIVEAAYPERIQFRPPIQVRMLRSIYLSSHQQRLLLLAPRVYNHASVGLGLRYASRNVREVLQLRRDQSRSVRQVLTFRPDKFTSVGQTVMDISSKWSFTVRVKQPSGLPGYALSASLHYKTKGKNIIPFPPQTRGVLYFHQLSVADFQRGTDLLLPDGSPWCIPFNRMQKLSSSHASFLSLLEDEYSMTVDPDLATDRIVSTLNPLNLLTHNQRVFDISGLSAAWVLIGDQPTGTPLYYRRGTHRKFPAHTKGVFYYKQSVTAPGKSENSVSAFVPTRSHLMRGGTCVSSPEKYGT